MRNPTAAILLSRQPLRSSGQTSWVKQTVQAVHWIKHQGFTLCTSIGMQTWELLAALASLEKIKQTLFVPAGSRREFELLRVSAVAQFALKSDLVEYVPVLCDNSSDKEEFWLKRDRAIVEAAQVLVPVSLRRNGHMETVINQCRVQGKEVVSHFQVPYEKRSELLAYSIQTDRLNPELMGMKDQYVIHWTRASNSAWPAEKLIDYYKAIIKSETYPRSALDTLMNIITTKRICASSKHMPISIPTVSFSGLPPVEVIPLMRWRSRYQQMSFEPYGIGIERDYAISLRIYPVRYYRRKSKRNNDNEAWLWQSIGERGDWRAEHEYRHKDDFSLVPVPLERMCVFCHIKKEAQMIEESTGIKAVSFISGDELSFQ
jgi:hypothetical protein